GDPRHIVDIVGNVMAKIMTDTAQNNNQEIPSAKKSWLGETAEQYRIPFTPFTLPADSPINIQKVGNTYINQALTTPRAFNQAGAVTIKTVGNQAYKQIGVNPDESGRWAP